MWDFIYYAYITICIIRYVNFIVLKILFTIRRFYVIIKVTQICVRSDKMSTLELCMFLDSILALLETDNAERAKEVIRNGIKRIDKGSTSNAQNDSKQEDQ